MPTLHQKSADQLARQQRYLLDPPAGTKAKAAQLHGVDLTLLIEQLNLTPAERGAKLEAATTTLESVRGIARKRV